MEIPAYYIYDAKFVPNKKNYIVTLTWHILPKQFTSNVQTTCLNGTIIDSTFQDLNKKAGKDIIIALQRADGRRGFEMI